MRALFRRPSESRPHPGARQQGGYAEPEDLSYAQAVAARGIGSSRDANTAAAGSSSRLRSSFDGLSAGAGIGSMPPPARPVTSSQVVGETRKAKVLGLGSRREKTRRRLELFGRKNADVESESGTNDKQSNGKADEASPEAQWRMERALADEARTWRASTRRSSDHAPIVIMGNASPGVSRSLHSPNAHAFDPASVPASPTAQLESRPSSAFAINGLTRPWDQQVPMTGSTARSGNVSSASESSAARSSTSRRAPPPHLTQIFADASMSPTFLAPPHRSSASVSLPHSPIESSYSTRTPRSPSRQRSAGSYGSPEPSPGHKAHLRASSQMAGILSPLSPGSFHTASSTIMSPPLLSASASSPPETADPTARLAQQLNELAIAHGDGLLGEEEYRRLRAAVFSDSGVEKEQVPREARLGSFGGQLSHRLNATEPIASQSYERPAPTPAPAHSLRSQRSSIANFTALFRTGSLRNLRNPPSANMQLDSSADSLNAQGSTRSKSRSIWTTAASAAGLARSPQRGRRATSEAELESEITRARTARALGASADDASAKHSLVGAGSGSMVSASGMLAGDYTEKGANELKAEMAVVEAEQKRLLEAFNGLVQNAIGRSGLGHQQLQRAQTSASRALSLETSAGTGDRILHGTTSQSLLRQSSTSSSGSRSPARSRRRGAGGSSHGEREGVNGPSPSYPPSAFRHAAQLRAGSSGTAAHFADDLDADMGDDPEDEVAVRALRDEIVDIARRREDVRRRYEERLAFLRSLVRSATLREGLRK